MTNNLVASAIQVCNNLNNTSFIARVHSNIAKGLRMLGHLYSKEVSNLWLPMLPSDVTRLYSCSYTLLLSMYCVAVCVSCSLQSNLELSVDACLQSLTHRSTQRLTWWPHSAFMMLHTLRRHIAFCIAICNLTTVAVHTRQRETLLSTYLLAVCKLMITAAKTRQREAGVD